MKEKILAFCLKHWKEIGLVLLLLIVFGKSQYDVRNIIKAHEIAEQSLKDQAEIKNLTRAEKEAIIREFKQDKALIIQRFEETYGLRYVE